MNLLIESLESHDKEKYKIFLKDHDHLNHPIKDEYPIIRILDSDNIDFAHTILFNNINFNVRNKDGITPIILLCTKKKFDLFELAIYNDCDLEFPDTQGKTVIFHALSMGLKDFVKLLMLHHVNLNLIDNQKRSPLFYVSNGIEDTLEKPSEQTREQLLEYYAAIVDRFINQGGEINAKDAKGMTALDLAVQNNNSEMVDVLLYYHADYTFNFTNTISLIDEAIQNNNMDMAFALLDINKDADILNASEKIDCSKNSKADDYQEIIKHFKNQLEGNEDHPESIKIKGYKDARNNIKSIIHNTTEHITDDVFIISDSTPKEDILNINPPSSFKDITEIKHHDKENKKIPNPLNLEEKIKKHGINERYKYGMTKLIMACASDNLELVKEYLDLGADVNKRDLKGSSALTYAAKNGNCEIIKELINHKAIIDVKDDAGLTPLAIAVATGKIKAVSELLRNGANAKITLKGRTCLMLAAAGGYNDIATILIANGVMVKQKDLKRRTAADYAKAHGHNSLYIKLRDYK